MPVVEAFLATPYQVLLRFGRWDEILKLPAPDEKLAMTRIFWHFARGTALAATAKLDAAEAERRAITELAKKVPADAIYSMYGNKAHHFIDVMDVSMDARFAAARGDHAGAAERWRKVVSLADTLNYGEPPEWYYPVRESLGAALLRAGRAAEAERTFRECLVRTPRNPRALFGLWQSLLAQKKAAEAKLVRPQFEAAWKNADVKLRVEDL